MKKSYSNIASLASAALLSLLVVNTGQAQCTDWDNPNPTGGWSDFNSTYGGAPCDDGTGCPFNEITDFEIWASEAYAMNNVLMGGTYTFSACNGAGGPNTGGAAWPISFTIIAPSGNVDAFGLDAGSTCALTWTATENGTYLIAVTEEGECGTSTNTSTDNGYPAITCQDGPEVDCGLVGIAETTVDQRVRISPNPTNGLFTVVALGEVSTIDVFDLNGRQLEGIAVSQMSAGTYQLDLSGYQAGTYIVRTQVNGQFVSQRLTLVP